MTTECSSMTEMELGHRTDKDGHVKTTGELIDRTQVIIPLSNQFADLLAQVGARRKEPHRKTLDKGRGVRDGAESLLSFHCLRHTSVTLLKEAGVPDAAIMALIGHDSVAMSQHYTHVGRDALEKASKAFPDVT